METRTFRLDEQVITVSPAWYEEGAYSVVKADTTSAGAGFEKWTVSGDNLEEQIAKILAAGYVEDATPKPPNRDVR